MRQYTFLNITKILYGPSPLNATDITLTLKTYLDANNNIVTFQIIENFVKNVWHTHMRRLYVYDQHYVASPCEITERLTQEFKILLTTGGSSTIKKNQNIKKLQEHTLQPQNVQHVKQNTQSIKQVVQPIIQSKDNLSGTILTYTKVRIPIIQLLKNSATYTGLNNKLCFLFMIYDRLNKKEIWDSFFSSADNTKYSIYIHSKSDIIESQRETLNKYLMKEKYSTEWGTWSLVEVQNRLLEKGLEDPENSKFLFVSDSHIPLHDFDTVYGCIMNNDFSFIDIMGRLTQNNLNVMNDVFNVGKSNMFKMSQWTCLNRTHAEQLLLHENDTKLQSSFSSIPDENAYICTLTGLYFPKKIENLCNKNLTFVDWIVPSSNQTHKAYPRTYDANDLDRLLQSIRNEYLFVRKVAQTCNVNSTVIQPHALTISAYPQFSNMIQMSNKTIISVFCKKTKNVSSDLRNFWGFGDMLRGAISIYKLSQEFGSQFYLTSIDHPICNYLKKQPAPHGFNEYIEKSKNNIYTFYRYFELADYVKRNLISSNYVAVHSNAVFKDRSNMIENEKTVFLSETDREILLKYFEPIDELREIVIAYQNKFPQNYNIIHFRLGDDFFGNSVDESQLELVESIFIENYEPNDVLITDNSHFKKYLKDKYNCLTLDTNIVHVGLSEDSSGIKETLVEWLIQAKSKKIKTYSNYGWISGFVFWTHQLFAIPIINMKKSNVNLLH